MSASANSRCKADSRSGVARRMVRLLLAAACVTSLAALGAPPDDARARPSAQAAPTCASFVYCGSVTADFSGSGSGTVVSDPPGIACTVTAGVESGDCTETFTWPRTIASFDVRLTLQPAQGSYLCASWQLSCKDGADQGKVGTAIFTLRPGLEAGVSEMFLLRAFALQVSRSGAGTGRVTSERAGIACGTDCSEQFEFGTNVTLTASPDAGAVFRAWTGACAGKGPVCTLRITEVTSTNAVFELPSPSPPPPSKPPPPPPPPAGPTPPTPPADRLVEADVGAAASGPTRLGARAVRVELALDEPLAVTLELRRNGATLARKRYARLNRGERVLALLVPPRVSPGPATLRVALADVAGNRKGARRQIVIGSRSGTR